MILKAGESRTDNIGSLLLQVDQTEMTIDCGKEQHRPMILEIQYLESQDEDGFVNTRRLDQIVLTFDPESDNPTKIPFTGDSFLKGVTVSEKLHEVFESPSLQFIADLSSDLTMFVQSILSHKEISLT